MKHPSSSSLNVLATFSEVASISVRDLNVCAPKVSLVRFFSNVIKFLLVVLKVQSGLILLFSFPAKGALKVSIIIPPIPPIVGLTCVPAES